MKDSPILKLVDILGYGQDLRSMFKWMLIAFMLSACVFGCMTKLVHLTDKTMEERKTIEHRKVAIEGPLKLTIEVYALLDQRDMSKKSLKNAHHILQQSIYKAHSGEMTRVEFDDVGAVIVASIKHHTALIIDCLHRIKIVVDEIGVVEGEIMNQPLCDN